ncbi:unnamed protein product [Nyctereutes procyonoides]|uniref:(raccoon dog) hypothetical protein n=1 Tax=Nyctereutes procyonoides TaxID=34880 RepID=A0A811YI85_NYCPR|nr:unnamed protein product [Nyctereutes procyonoides]
MNTGGIPGWRSGLAPAFGPGRDPGDPGSNPTSGSWCMEPASPSACSGGGSGEGPAEGAGGRRGRGAHAARPVPTESRARVAANRRAALSWERGGCGERRTETGDVFKPGLRGVRGGCSGDEDNDSDGNTEALVQGVNPPAPIVPRVREGEGGVATGEEEGGARRGFEPRPRRLGGDPSVPRCSRPPSPEQASLSAIFPTAFAHFVSLYHILQFLEIPMKGALKNQFGKYCLKFY